MKSQLLPFVLLIILFTTMIVLRHYWADFAAGMDYPFTHHCQCP